MLSRVFGVSATRPVAARCRCGRELNLGRVFVLFFVIFLHDGVAKSMCVLVAWLCEVAVVAAAACGCVGGGRRWWRSA